MLPAPAEPTSSPSDWLIFSACIVLGIIGALGNGFILLVIRRRNLRTTTMSLIANQAVSDMSCGLLYMSLWALCSERVIRAGPGGLATCDLAYTVKVATFFVSVYTMVLISVDRYLKLCHYPPKRLCLSVRSWIGLIWTGGLVTSVLCMFHFRVSLFFSTEGLVGCRLAYNVSGLPFFDGHYNALVILCLTGLGPILITGWMYYRVIVRLGERALVGTQLDDKAERLFNKNRRRTVHMLISTLVSYYCLCGPLYATYIISYFIVPILPKDCGPSTREPFLYLAAYFLSVTSICVNPVIYCYYNPEFRAEAKRVLTWVHRKERDESIFHTQGTL